MGRMDSVSERQSQSLCDGPIVHVVSGREECTITSFMCSKTRPQLSCLS